MLGYVLRRLLYMVPVLLGVALLVFLLFHAVGEDPARVALGQHASPEALAQLRARWGLDQPLVQQFAEFLRQTVRLDFGRSLNTNEKLSDLFAAGAKVSLGLTVPPFILGFVLNASLGLLVAYRRGSWVDRFSSFGCIAAMSVSYLVYIVALQYLLAYRLEWFPVSGYVAGVESVRYFALPWIIIVLASVGPDVRMYRSVFLDELHADYMRTARAKGAGELRALYGHAFKNALIPILTYTMVGIPFLALGAFLMERYFSLPGVGDLMITAINNGDFPVIKGLTMIIALAYSAIILVTDLLYAWVDPRVTLR